jgi:hypothetical protein
MMEKVGGATLPGYALSTKSKRCSMRSIRRRKSVIIISPGDIRQMECHQTMLDGRQAGFNPGKPKSNLGLNFIQLAMYTPEHFMGEVFNIVGHGGSLVGYHSKVYHEVVGGRADSGVSPHHLSVLS